MGAIILCKTTTATVGTSDYVLSTVVNNGPYRTPKQATLETRPSLVDGQVVTYLCRDTTILQDASFEYGKGIYDDTANEVSRSAVNVLDSSGGDGVQISWPASGQRDFYILEDAAETIALHKAANEIVNNSVTLQDDDDIKFLIRTTEKWSFRLMLVYTSSVAQIKLGWTIPSPGVVDWALPPSDAVGELTQIGTLVIGPSASSRIMIVQGVISSLNASGLVQLQWAQDVADASDSTLLQKTNFVASLLSGISSG